MIVKKDCFGYVDDSHCRALIDKEMNCPRCKFYKTKAEYDEKVAPLRHKKKNN